MSHRPYTRTVFTVRVFYKSRHAAIGFIEIASRERKRSGFPRSSNCTAEQCARVVQLPSTAGRSDSKPRRARQKWSTSREPAPRYARVWFLRYIVAAVIVMPSVVPAATAPNAAHVFRAGAATSNITPPLGYPLDGVIAQGAPARHVHDDLHARCLVLDDGTMQIALVVVDNTMVAREIFERSEANGSRGNWIPGEPDSRGGDTHA